ncbi:MAG: CRTAC1 family protein [Verrucomicrobiota bacterium]
MRLFHSHLRLIWAGPLSVFIFGLTAAEARFVDATAEAGVSYLQMGTMEGALPVEQPTTHLQTGGAAAFDYDDDGWVDLFVTRMNAPDILFRNLGPDADGVVRFEDVSAAAGFTAVTNSNGVAAVDIDNDGDIDLYVSTLYARRFLLYINNGDGTFTERASGRGAALTLDLSEQPGARHHGFGVAAGDYDRDGWIDFHLTHWDVQYATGDSAALFPNAHLQNVLLRNLGDNAPGFFGNATEAAGVFLRGLRRHPTAELYTQYAFSSSFADMDDDGWPDLLVASDFTTSQLFWNNGDGTFTEGTEAAGVGLDENGMGLTIADYDGDGDLDWFVTSIRDNRLYRNLGNRQFEELGDALGLMNAGWGWGTAFFDYDNDRDLDLVMTNGHEDLYGQFGVVRSIDRSAFWRNEGDGTFTRVSEEVGIYDEAPGKGLLTFDYDNDGDLDVFIANAQTTPILYRNDTVNDHAWLRVKLEGRRSNPQGIGARLTLTTAPGETPLTHEVIGGTTFLAQSELTAHFGLGPGVDGVEQLEVRWPSGLTQTLRALPAREEITVREPVTFAQWRERYFRPAERSDESLSGKSADPDGDGSDNFSEYAFGRHPRVADAPTPSAATGESALRVEGDTVIARFASPMGAPEASYRYEVSTDLQSWTTVGDSSARETHLVASDGQHEFLEFPLEQPPATTLFLRVRASEAAR